MKKNKKENNKLVLNFVIVSVVLLIIVLFTMNYVQRQIRQDVRISLMEIVNQNKEVITSNINLEVNNLDVISKQISDKISVNGDISNEAIEDAFLDYCQRMGDPYVSWANAEGQLVYGNGEKVNIAGRNYFQIGMEGKNNISERIVSRLNGKEIFVICVPLWYNNEVIGTIQKQYTPEEMYEICAISVYSEQGSMHIINSEGYILITSDSEHYNNETDNYYRMLYLDNPEESKALENNLRDGKGGFLETKINGTKYFASYTPIDIVYDWNLITCIETTAVTGNSNSALTLMYIILYAFLVLFTAAMVYIIIVRDRQQKRLEILAFVDHVTGGNTYAKFRIDAKRMFEGGGIGDKFSIVTMDIDGFKYINRFYGFEAGDSALRRVYDYCNSFLESDECIARISSDYFVFGLKNVTDDRLEQMFCSELTENGIIINISSGRYPIVDMTESLNFMVDKANIARSTTKGKHLKTVGSYSKRSDEELAKQEQIKNDVEQAIGNNEIIPFFQPKVDTLTNKLVGAEALARWIKPDGKMIFPDQFIPICEETGLIRKIDWKIFEKTLDFIKRKLDEGIECVPISVNFSKINLINSEFLDNIGKKIVESGVPSKLIEIELTETVIFDHGDIIDKFINQVHDIGLKVSMDDFGSGYSSLQMLKDVDIDVLKIDKAFLQGTTNSNKQKIVFETIVHMASKLGLDIVVEGVETMDNIELMRSAGCSVAQGYYYSRPIPEEAFEKLYKCGLVEPFK